jgi:DNA-binding MarR family transcriptional regulator
MKQNPESKAFYSLVWRHLHLTVHRYGSMPTGQMLTILTIITLSDLGYYPTVTELAEITGIPKSSISRYISAEMAAGLLEEIIDPGDRRRRRLRPTAAAEAEREWHAGEAAKIYEIVTKAKAAAAGSDYAIEVKQLIRGLKKLTSERPERLDP